VLISFRISSKKVINSQKQSGFFGPPCNCFVFINASAKVAEDNEITPQSNYVTIHYDGRCRWKPRFEESAIRCVVDVRWFPFDDQRCSLIFESWVLQDNALRIVFLQSRDIYKYYFESDEWNLECASLHSLLPCD